MKIFRLFKSLFFLCLTLVVTSLSAQEVIGTWKGSLTVQGTELPIVVRIWQEDGTYKALMDSPQQNAIGIKVESVKYENKMLSISVPSLAVTIAGTISGTTYSANFTQGNIELPLVMDRTSTSATICRKQEPLPPYPYHTEEVKFPSVDSGVELNGTLTLPKESGKYPAVVLVSGSGTQNRDEELLGHKPFKVIADYLTRQDIIVLRYDDREFASKKYEGATSRNYANDALGAVEFLKSIDKVDSKRIGIIGHSEGGTIAFMCAAQNKEIDFIVSLAGMAVAGDKCLLEQNRRTIAITGLSEEMQNKCIEVTQAIFDETQKREVGDLRQSAKKIVDELIAKHSAQNLPPALIQNFEKTLSTINEWMKFFLSYDPIGDIKQIKCPVLALNGSLDVQVLADDNLNVLKSAPNLQKLLTAKKYEGLNHLFQPCATGDVSEYASIEQTISEEVLSDIAEWILRQ